VSLPAADIQFAPANATEAGAHAARH